MGPKAPSVPAFIADPPPSPPSGLPVPVGPTLSFAPPPPPPIPPLPAVPPGVYLPPPPPPPQ